VFTGVPLRVLLERAGVEEDAIEVVATGGDADSFQRALPLDVAMRPDVLLAWRMNDEPIPRPNGGPVRMIVPGWAGIASVKWPVHIEVVNTPFQGYWNAERYIMVDENGRTVRSVREMPVKSVIAWPRDGDALTPGSHTVRGFAWSGYGQIERVDVSVDDRKSWSPARVIHGHGPLAWTRWEYDWTPSMPGTFRLAVRAADSAGNVQPDHVAWNKFGYQMHAIVAHQVSVQA
jgi:DMSO/TMAO reductase YedYZ molybdopterin-dependent catalytic subunit